MSAVDSWMQTRTGPGCVVPCTLVRWCIGQGFYSGMLYQNAHHRLPNDEHETLVQMIVPYDFLLSRRGSSISRFLM